MASLSSTDNQIEADEQNPLLFDTFWRLTPKGEDEFVLQGDKLSTIHREILRYLGSLQKDLRTESSEKEMQLINVAKNMITINEDWVSRDVKAELYKLQEQDLVENRLPFEDWPEEWKETNIPKKNSSSSESQIKSTDDKKQSINFIFENVPTGEDGAIMLQTATSAIRSQIREQGIEIGYFIVNKKMCDFCHQELPFEHLTDTCTLSECSKTFDICTECQIEQDKNDQAIKGQCHRHQTSLVVTEPVRDHQYHFELNHQPDEKEFNITILGTHHSTTTTETN